MKTMRQELDARLRLNVARALSHAAAFGNVAALDGQIVVDVRGGQVVAVTLPPEDALASTDEPVTDVRMPKRRKAHGDESGT